MRAVMPLTFVSGDATSPGGAGNKIIAHVSNDIGAWGKGFVVAITRRWRQPENDFRAWYSNRADNDFELGAVQLVQVEPDTWVANIVGQHGIVGRQGIRVEGGWEPASSGPRFATRRCASAWTPWPGMPGAWMPRCTCRGSVAGLPAERGIALSR